MQTTLCNFEGARVDRFIDNTPIDRGVSRALENADRSVSRVRLTYVPVITVIFTNIYRRFKHRTRLCRSAGTVYLKNVTYNVCVYGTISIETLLNSNNIADRERARKYVCRNLSKE